LGTKLEKTFFHWKGRKLSFQEKERPVNRGKSLRKVDGEVSKTLQGKTK